VIRFSPSAVPAFFLLSAIAAEAQPPKQPAAPRLMVHTPIISQFEDGPSVPAAEKFVPGETGFFRFGVAGFRLSDSGRVQLTGHAQVFDPNGTPAGPRDEVVIATSLREEDKDWRPVLKFQFQLPAIAPGGTWKIKFEATDDQTKALAAAETTFPVVSRDVAPSPSLVIRNLYFYRSADDETPLHVAAYRAGDSVWVKFDVTGYKHGEQNATDVSYDVAVTSAGGKQLFSQENAAVERSQAFYPQPWVPGSFSLTLQATMAKGDYNVEITARDGIGNQSVRSTAAFRVE